MNDGFQFIDIIFFAMVAGFLILRLRSVLGRRTGNEQRRPDFFGQERGDNVVELPARKGQDPALDAEVETLAAAASPVGAGLTQIRLADPNFTPDGFVSGAKAAFEMILGAFAAGDDKALKPLLSPEVFANFKDAIDQRRKNGETLEAELIGINQAEIVGAAMEARTARVTVRFVTEQVNVLRDAENRVVEGDPARVTRVTDVWTFTRDTRSRDPNWQLVATAAHDDETVAEQ